MMKCNLIMSLPIGIFDYISLHTNNTKVYHLTYRITTVKDKVKEKKNQNFGNAYQFQKCLTSQ
jgi:hypothetical protein